jgi:hypothetical protein
MQEWDTTYRYLNRIILNLGYCIIHYNSLQEWDSLQKWDTTYRYPNMIILNLGYNITHYNFLQEWDIAYY